MNVIDKTDSQNVNLRKKHELTKEIAAAKSKRGISSSPIPEDEEEICNQNNQVDMDGKSQT